MLATTVTEVLDTQNVVSFTKHISIGLDHYTGDCGSLLGIVQPDSRKLCSFSLFLVPSYSIRSVPLTPSWCGSDDIVHPK